MTGEDYILIEKQPQFLEMSHKIKFYEWCETDMNFERKLKFEKETKKLLPNQDLRQLSKRLF
jgi:hypothetical protein